MANAAQIKEIKGPLIEEEEAQPHNECRTTKQTKKSLLKKWARKFKRVIMTVKQKMLFKRKTRKVPKQHKVTIHFVRAAEGSQNDEFDPSVSRTGYLQAHCLAKKFRDMDKVTHIICSPMRRALETAMLGFGPAISRGVPFIAMEELRDMKTTGSALVDLKREFAHSRVDFSLIREGWEWTQPDEEGETWHDLMDIIFTFALFAASGEQLEDCVVKNADGKPTDVHLVVITHGSVLGVTGKGGLCHELKLGRHHLDAKDNPNFAPCHRFYHGQFRSVELWKRISKRSGRPCVTWRETRESWNRVWMLVGNNIFGCCSKDLVLPSTCPRFWGHVRNIFSRKNKNGGKGYAKIKTG